jgi:hypothetical protein
MRTAVGKQWWRPAMLVWFLRRGFWNNIAWFKFKMAKPLDIDLPTDREWYIEPKPMIKAIPEVPLRNVKVCTPDDIPRDERSFRNSKFFDVQVWAYTTLASPMQQCLPSIDADPKVALKRAFNGLRRTLLPPPELPAEYEDSPDLGSLAVRGPFACYTTKVDDPTLDEPTWEWNLLLLNDFKHHEDLKNIGSRVLFHLDPLRRALQACRIECALDTNPIEVTDPRWDQACKIALCAVSTHLSLVRHFNWVHLVGGAHLAIATRNCLSADHPLCRLLWPCIFGTQQSNDMVTRAQMVRGGDFETTFSFTLEGMCDLFDQTYLDYDYIVNDPEQDGDDRKVRNAGFDTPTQDNLEELFNIMNRFTRNYLQIYYKSAPPLLRDHQVMAWLEELNERVPHGVGVDPTNVTREKLARLLAQQLFSVTVQHEILGSFMWNYQLWTHRQPARIYNDFRREPLDVYQRLVNANYILNVNRRALMYDFSYLAGSNRAAMAMSEFQSELTALQAQMDSKPGAVWRVEPKDLKVNINA